MGQNTILGGDQKEPLFSDDGSTDLEERITDRLEQNRLRILKDLVDEANANSIAMSDWRHDLGLNGPDQVTEGHMLTLVAEGQEPLTVLLAPHQIKDIDPRLIVLTPGSPAHSAIVGKKRGDEVSWNGGEELWKIHWTHWLGRKPKGEIQKEV